MRADDGKLWVTDIDTVVVIDIKTKKIVKKIKVKGEVVEAVDVFVGGRSGPDSKVAVKLLEDVPCDKLPEVLCGILPYHSRQKMHRTKARSIRIMWPI